MDIRTHLKSYFQDRAIVKPEQADQSPDSAIILQQFTGGEETEIAKTQVRLVKNILQPAERDILSISKIFPPRVKLSKAGEDIPATYVPVADWNGKHLRIVVPENTINVSVRNALFAGLPSLLHLSTKNENGINVLRQKMSLGLVQERTMLLNNAEKNRKYANEQLDKIHKFLESANRQERIAAGLEKLEQGQLDEFAESQWEDLQRMIPGVLQDVYVEGDCINSITNPIVISGVFIGACKIQVNISSAEVMVYAIEQSTMRNGHCHPHVQDDGNPCWGNLERKMTDMSAKRDYYGLISATLRLLHQYTHDDAYAKLHEWGYMAAKPEEGLSCQKYGPGHSYAQMRNCLECEEVCHYSLDSKISACQQLHSITDCLVCKIGEEHCRLWPERYTKCYKSQCQAGVAYCLIKCEDKECSYLEDAQHLCKKQNLPAKEDCPAKTICRIPCQKEEK